METLNTNDMVKKILEENEVIEHQTELAFSDDPAKQSALLFKAMPYFYTDLLYRFNNNLDTSSCGFIRLKDITSAECMVMTYTVKSEIMMAFCAFSIIQPLTVIVYWLEVPDTFKRTMLGSMLLKTAEEYGNSNGCFVSVIGVKNAEPENFFYSNGYEKDKDGIWMKKLLGHVSVNEEEMTEDDEEAFEKNNDEYRRLVNQK